MHKKLRFKPRLVLITYIHFKPYNIVSKAFSVLIGIYVLKLFCVEIKFRAIGVYSLSLSIDAFLLRQEYYPTPYLESL